MGDEYVEEIEEILQEAIKTLTPDEFHEFISSATEKIIEYEEKGSLYPSER